MERPKTDHCRHEGDLYRTQPRGRKVRPRPVGRKVEQETLLTIKSQRKNWEELIAFLDFLLEIRRIIYTTKIIENLNEKVRKYAVTSFPY